MFDLKSQVLARKYVYLYLQDGRNDETSAKLINGEDIIRCVSSPFHYQLRSLSVCQVVALLNEIFVEYHMHQLGDVALQPRVEDALV